MSPILPASISKKLSVCQFDRKRAVPSPPPVRGRKFVLDSGGFAGGMAVGTESHQPEIMVERLKAEPVKLETHEVLLNTR